ncbi:cell wall-binding repeat-containing protein [Pseudalkalibacillus caeni]|uniref:N-acetylmuramoyl-L-alanine amidase n=1 Tax=Exobacillus caeni TaxID=2574798 RepID=A0A5R9F8B5_9BACL|nr:cell wall-binding repeat-containing protein [Pseudalkalibacillus caeni]TLS38490.1 hypothetical protein FCL54_04955 [Pseudalkalibacillus caeni]
MRKACISVLVILLFLLTFADVKYADSEMPIRFDGKDRFEVAVNVSKRGWPKAENVIIVNYLAFADALAASPLAYKLNAPILLTHPNKLTGATKDEIKRLSPSKVSIIGGPGSVSGTVEKELKDLGVSTERITGEDRFEVAHNIAKKLGQTSTVTLANGLKFPDALAIAPYAARKGYPILLTRENDLPAVTKKDITGKGKVIIVGGRGSVSDSIANQFSNKIRIDGKDRFEVSANVISTLNLSVDKAYISTGLSFADALTGSVMAAKDNAALLLTSPNRLSSQTEQIIMEEDIEKFSFLGGNASISDSVASYIMFHRPTDDPVVYFVPHADDEVLTYAVDIRNAMKSNRPIYLVLLSKGEDSGARDIQNGSYDEQSINSELAGKPVYCWFHSTYHDPVKEGYLHGHLSKEEFGDLRVDDFLRASKAMGVASDHLFVDTIPNTSLSKDNVIEKMNVYINKFPNADFRTMSKDDAHPPHALLGRALEELELRGRINPYKTIYFVSMYTDRFSGKKLDIEKQHEEISDQSDHDYINRSIDEYKYFIPEEGIYANGYHSVPSQFNTLSRNMYTSYYY